MQDASPAICSTDPSRSADCTPRSVCLACTRGRRRQCLLARCCCCCRCACFRSPSRPDRSTACRTCARTASTRAQKGGRGRSGSCRPDRPGRRTPGCRRLARNPSENSWRHPRPAKRAGTRRVKRANFRANHVWDAAVRAPSMERRRQVRVAAPEEEEQQRAAEQVAAAQRLVAAVAWAPRRVDATRPAAEYSPALQRVDALCRVSPPPPCARADPAAPSPFPNA